MAKLRVGDVAPDFTLSDQSGNSVKLAEFRGQSAVVLIFYPGDETPICTMQLCAARDSMDSYQKAGVKVFGVNQGAAESHQKFSNHHKLTTPLLVDKGLAISEKYDAVMGLGPLKLINRTVVAIDKDGKITFYRRGTPDTSDILASFKSNKKPD
ncbi:MAG: peroxiredoxin [Chloroflexota bacterium]|nr:peroxiredoxin [Chloroflexota bacterium]